MGSCAECVYAVPMMCGEDLVLSCRRFPPQIFWTDQSIAVQSWPHVDGSDWCGEFSERPDDERTET